MRRQKIKCSEDLTRSSKGPFRSIFHNRSFFATIGWVKSSKWFWNLHTYVCRYVNVNTDTYVAATQVYCWCEGWAAQMHGQCEKKAKYNTGCVTCSNLYLMLNNWRGSLGSWTCWLIRASFELSNPFLLKVFFLVAFLVDNFNISLLLVDHHVFHFADCLMNIGFLH